MGQGRQGDRGHDRLILAARGAEKRQAPDELALVARRSRPTRDQRMIEGFDTVYQLDDGQLVRTVH